jgi:nitroreductase
MDANEWIEAFAARLDTAPPSEEEVERILELAGIAAHASGRIAAPQALVVAE